VLAFKVNEGERVKVVNAEELESLASVYKALGNKTRLSVLLQLEEDDPVTPLTDELDITRSGLQSNIERLIDANLVYRPVDKDPTYALTPVGELMVGKIQADQIEIESVLEKFHSILEELRESQKETLEHMEEAGVDTKELENKLQAEAWEKTGYQESEE
jgi:DNA-binding transcriptional ArsR family regulator